ncbi:S8 family serine peptidase [Montanilutibacter psychrotolerans]|uniref:PKD domain-containing protein n=1 Tax=Montanilutibacter psychrotolerans TaxID=1327343 RepID=A0A3M8SSZ8_9GAMM|nr:S8 family serine peptidase [Lysobacter psychrotolerans]RNF82354.1 PKD domain-containing protein [Lysobacter psychrotolerans]
MSNTRKQAVKLHMSALASAVLLGMSAVSAHAAELKTVDRPVAGEYIVVLKKEAASLTGEVSLMGGVRRSPVATIAQQMARSHNGRLLRTYKKALRGFVVKADDKALARLLADNRVAYVQENGIVQLFDTQANAVWSLDRIDQRDLPLSGSYTYDTTAAGVHAYVIDTGIRADHTEFTGRLGAGFTSELDGRGTEDCQGHGTHVAGTVGGTRWGVAKGVTVHPVRVFGCGRTTTGDKILAGIDWVTENHVKPAVVNMSLGGPADQAEDDAVQAMIDSGVITVIAAGNNNGDACLNSPARLPAAITVGATMSNDRRPDTADWGALPAQGSNYGACLDIFAPGDNITSASRTGSQASTSMSGTSMAAPAVAGAAALYLAVHPLATQAEVAQALINSSTPNKVTNQGVGSPNRLLYSIFAGGGNPPGNVAPVANFSSSVNGLVVQFTDSSTDSDGNIASHLWTFGDGTTSAAPSPKKTYTAAGTYTVTLKVTDDDGATHTKTASVTVASSGGTVLTNGVAKTGLSGAAGSSQYFTLVVPAGATNLKFVTSGGTGDLDLYAQLGSQPTTSSFACKSEGGANAETCTVAVAQAGTYHVLVKGYSAFSGASLTGSYTAGTGGTQTYSNAADYTISDGVTVDSPITVSGRSDNAPTNASVTVAIVHSFQGDLKVDLVAPDGSLYNIHNRSGGATDDINKTVTLNLSTEALNGTWKLRVNDAGPGDVGKIDSWSITF